MVNNHPYYAGAPWFTAALSLEALNLLRQAQHKDEIKSSPAEINKVSSEQAKQLHGSIMELYLARSVTVPVDLKNDLQGFFQIIY